MSKKGTSTFIMQRASAVLIIPFAIWFLVSLAAHAGDSFADMNNWLRQPLTSGAFAVFIVIGAFHMRIGMAEVIIDYIHSWLKDVLLFLNWVVSFGVMALAIWSVYQLSFAG